LRVIYKGLLRKAQIFDKYPLLKAWCDYPLYRHTQKKWYRPKISFYQEVRLNFRNPQGYYNLQQPINEALEVYRYWNNIQLYVSSKVIGFNEYLELRRFSLIPVQVPPVITPINKIETGSILITHPRFDNPQWSKSIILILNHNSNNTIGVILNKPSESVQAIENELLDEQLALTVGGGHISVGGPVNGTILLHQSGGSDREVNNRNNHLVMEGLYYLHTNTLTNRKLISQYTKGTKNYRLFIGYAEWFPGQLQGELDQGLWFLAKCPLSILFPPSLPTPPLTQALIEEPSTPSYSPLKEEESASAAGNTPVPAGEGQENFSLYSAYNEEELWIRVLQLMGGEYYHFAFARFQRASQY